MRKLRILFKLLVVIAIFVCLYYSIQYDPGFVQITYGNFLYQSKLWTFFVLVALVWFLWKFIRFIFSFTGISFAWLNPWSSRNRGRRSAKSEQKGLFALAEGRWDVAANELAKAARNNDYPVFLYLDAAEAASNAGNYDKATKYIEKASEEADDDSTLALAIAKSKVEFAQNKLESARATLEGIYDKTSEHSQLLKLLVQIYDIQGDSTALLNIISDAYKYNVLPLEQLKNIEKRAWINKVNAKDEAGDIEQIGYTWSMLPANLRQDNELVSLYIQKMCTTGSSIHAEEFLRKEIKRHYDSNMMIIYGQVSAGVDEEQLNFAKKIANSEKDYAAFLTLGRLYKRIDKLEDAQNAFEQSLKLQQSYEAYVELASVLSSSNEANLLLKQAISILRAPQQEAILLLTQQVK